MSTDVERQQQKMKEFMSLLPVTIELAGLPKAEPGKLFTESQMDNRVALIKHAYRMARQLVLDVSKPSE